MEMDPRMDSGPDRRADAAGVRPAMSAAMVALTILLISVTVLQRFGLNLGSYSLNAALPAMYGLLIIAGLTRVLAVSIPRTALFAVCACIALGSTIMNEERASASSLVLLIAMYLPLVFVLTPSSGATPARVLRCFSNVALFCAVAGVAQFYAQFFMHAAWLFDFTSMVPAVLRGPDGFNTVIPVGSLFKSNGFFFREPSGFSFMMALALMAESLTDKRIGRILCFGLALLLTYSGTGLLALLIGMLIPLNRKTLFWLALVLGVGAVLVFLLDGVLNLSFTLGRLSEFGSERSSGYIRYIAPGRLLSDTAQTEPWTLWLGHGAGSISRKETGYEFHDPTWAKLVFEYGVLGFVAFVALFWSALRAPLVPLRVRVMLFAAWLIMGGHLLSPEQCFITFALVGLLPRDGVLAPATSARPRWAAPVPNEGDVQGHGDTVSLHPSGGLT
jgi:hypothetical protein